MNGDVEIRRVGDNKYVVNIPGEDHTIGSLLQALLSKDDRVKLAYYNQPHPLEDRIEVFISLNGDYDPKQIIVEALDKIIALAREAREKLLQAYREAGIEVEE